MKFKTIKYLCIIIFIMFITSGCSLPSHKHEIIFIEEKEPTCCEFGNIAHYQCIKCERKFSEEEGLNELKNSEVKIDTISHNLDDKKIKFYNHNNELISLYYCCISCDGLFDNNIGDERLSLDNVLDKDIIPALNNLSFNYTSNIVYPRFFVEYDNDIISDSMFIYSYKKVNEMEYMIIDIDNNQGPVDAGKYDISITYTNKNGESISKYINYTINPISLEAADITLDNYEFLYNGSTHTPTVNSVTLNGYTLNNLEYRVRYENNIEVGTEAKVIVEGIGNYSGQSFVTFTIKTKVSLENAVITLSNTSYSYSGENISPIVQSVKIGDTLLTEGTDYLITYNTNDRINVGRYTLNVRAIDSSDYTGFKSIEFSITPKVLNISNRIIERAYDSANRTYGSIINAQFNTEIKNSISGIVDKDLSSINVEVQGIHDGTFGFGSYDTSNFNQTSITGITKPTNLVGSTYYTAFKITSNNNAHLNYKFNDSSSQSSYMYLKYKTVNVNGTLYTIEDAINANGDMILSKGTSSSDYVYTAFTNLNTSDNPYKNYNKNYTISNKNLIVPKKDGQTDISVATENLLSNYTINPDTTGSNDVVSALFIPETIVINFNNGIILVDSELGGTIGITTLSKYRGVILNRGIINLNNSKLYSLGYTKGEGDNSIINVNGSSIIVDCWTQYDYPGGNTILQLKDDCLPINAWTIHNVSCKTKVSSSSEYYAIYTVKISGAGQNVDVVNIGKIVSTNQCLFVADPVAGQEDDTYIIKSTKNLKTGLLESNQKATTNKDYDYIEIYGRYKDSNLSLSVQGQELTNKYTSGSRCSKCKPDCNVTVLGFLDLKVCTGAQLTLDKASYLFMPGSTVTVDGTLNVSSSNINLILETINHIQNSAISSGGMNFNKFKRSAENAVLNINGTVNIASNARIAGKVVPTSSNAKLNISSTNGNIANKYVVFNNNVGASDSGDMAYSVQDFKAFGPYSNGEVILNIGNHSSTLLNGNYVWYGTSSSTTHTIANNGSVSSAHNYKFSCITGDTLILMADGTYKKAEDIRIGNEVIVFDHFTGQLITQEILVNAHINDEPQNHIIVKLNFSDGSFVEVIAEHNFYDVNLNKYVSITYDNYQDYIGHTYIKYDNNLNKSYVTLESASIREDYIKVYSPVSVWHLNMITNNILSSTYGTVNFFEYDENMKYIEEDIQRQVELYGEYTYDDFKDYVTLEIFNSFPFKYFKIGIGKGETSYDTLMVLLNAYYNAVNEPIN